MNIAPPLIQQQTHCTHTKRSTCKVKETHAFVFVFVHSSKLPVDYTFYVTRITSNRCTVRQSGQYAWNFEWYNLFLFRLTTQMRWNASFWTSSFNTNPCQNNKIEIHSHSIYQSIHIQYSTVCESAISWYVLGLRLREMLRQNVICRHRIKSSWNTCCGLGSDCNPKWNEEPVADASGYLFQPSPLKTIVF